jgi:hypothetical protein
MEIFLLYFKYIFMFIIETPYFHSSKLKMFEKKLHLLFACHLEKNSPINLEWKMDE